VIASFDIFNKNQRERLTEGEGIEFFFDKCVEDRKRSRQEACALFNV
jgi:hypothetical protein